MRPLTPYWNWSPSQYDRKGLGLPDYQDWLLAPIVLNPSIATVSEEANWLAMLDAYDKVCQSLELDASNGYRTFAFAHWFTGYRIALINPKCPELISAAQQIAARLEENPILCERKLAEVEHAAQESNWRQMTRQERRESIRRHDPHRDLHPRYVTRMARHASVPRALWNPSCGWSDVLGIQM
jgi:hypothetical protein